MKIKFLVITLSITFSSSILADNICEFESFRSENSHLCITNPAQGWFEASHVPSSEFINFVGGQDKFDNQFSDSGASEGGNRGNRLMENYKSFKKQANDDLAKGSSTYRRYSSETSKRVLEAQAIENGAKKLQIEISGNDGDSLKASLNKFLEKNPTFDKTLYGNIVDSNGAISQECAIDVSEGGCQQKMNQLLQFRTSEITEMKDKAEKIKAKKEAFIKKANEQLKEMDEAYSGEFKKLALKKLAKADPSLKGLKTLKEACTKASTNRSPAISVCEKLQSELTSVKSAVATIKDSKEKVENAADIMEMLKLKLDFSDLNNEQRQIAMASLAPDVRKKLDGTVLGSLMDQMREDMCNVAAHHETMCAGESANFKSLVNDSAEIAKEAIKFQSRKISGSAGASKN
jgi:ElaB/YqjD/DUF883 family membrane-anchored ribosome-binding protein